MPGHLEPLETDRRSLEATASGFRPVRRRSVSEAVYEQLRDQIVSGDLAPGQSLPGERKLSEMLSTNRGGVREALKRLVQAGLVVTQHGGSTRVQDYRRSGTLDLLQEILINHNGNVVPAVGRSLMELRKVVLAEVTRLAAERGDSETGQRLRLKLAEARTWRDDPMRFRTITWQFWEVLADAADSLAFVLTLNTLRGAYEQVGMGVSHIPVSEDELVSLERIITAVEQRDGQAAARIATERFDRTRRMIRLGVTTDRAAAS